MLRASPFLATISEPLLTCYETTLPVWFQLDLQGGISSSGLGPVLALREVEPASRAIVQKRTSSLLLAIDLFVKATDISLIW